MQEMKNIREDTVKGNPVKELDMKVYSQGQRDRLLRRGSTNPYIDPDSIEFKSWDAGYNYHAVQFKIKPDKEEIKMQNEQKDSTINNGGTTGYYDVPRPERRILFQIITQQDVKLETILNQIEALLPKTLNDLIEYKNMPFWRGEAFKALYALVERAARSEDMSASEERELNKVIYYCNRRLAQIKKDRPEKIPSDQGDCLGR